MADWLAQPFFGGLAAFGCGSQLSQVCPPLAGLPVRHRDQPEVLQPLRGAVDLCLVHVPDPAQAAIGR